MTHNGLWIYLFAFVLFPAQSVRAIESLPFDRTNPVILINEEGDTVTYPFLICLSHGERLNVIGVCNSTVALRYIEGSGVDFMKAQPAAVVDGFENVPDSYLHSDWYKALSRPKSGEFDATAPIENPSSRMICEKVLEHGTEAKPVVLAVGGSSTPVASAYLLAQRAGRGEEFASKAVVCAIFGVYSDQCGVSANEFNIKQDVWAAYICLQRLRTVWIPVRINNQMVGPTNAELSEFIGQLPETGLANYMREKISAKNVSDGDAPILTAMVYPEIGSNAYIKAVVSIAFRGWGKPIPEPGEVHNHTPVGAYRLQFDIAQVDASDDMMVIDTDRSICLSHWKREVQAAFASLERDAMTTVFERGAEGYNFYRIPALVRAANGELLAFCEARHGGDASEIDLVVKRSSDHGTTWGPVQVIEESDDYRPLFQDDDYRELYGGQVPPITVGNPVPVVDHFDPEHPGRIWLLYTLENDRVFCVFSNDHGASWSDRREITRDVKRPDWGWYATGPVHAIQIQHGPHRGRLVVPADHRVGHRLGKDYAEDRGPYGAQAILSDDHGRTWRLGAIDDSYDDPLFANETAVVELAGGALYFNTRDNDGEARGTRGEAWSYDGGETFISRSDKWSGFRPCPPILDPPVVQCSLLRVRDDLILFCGPDVSGPSAPERADLRIRYSTDGAKSWRDGPILYVGPAAYSDMALLPGDRVGVLFEGNVPGTRLAHQWINFKAFSLDQIVAHEGDE